MNKRFFEEPILNSPYEEPTLYHDLDENNQPTGKEPIKGRRPFDYIVPVPKPRRRKAKVENQEELQLKKDDGISSDAQEYARTLIIETIRPYLKIWRRDSDPQNWGVTPVTARLLTHWRHHKFSGIRPFFCQIEAVETIIWLTEVAKKDKEKSKAYKKIWTHIEDANKDANKELIRLAMKMATGAGKTTVMAMLIAWQTLNAARSPESKLFTKGFLIVTPGITIKDRLRVLNPYDPDSYYKTRELIPRDMLPEMGKAKIVITNYHAFHLRELSDSNKTARSLLKGRGKDIQTKETSGKMVRRVARELMGIKNIVVINDEAHHCYREKPEGEQDKLKGEEKKEAEENNKAARLWISGIEMFKKELGVRSVYDLSATPFFLGGSGWVEGTLFPWTVSDFSLMDAIESGIVKLPRVPVDDNRPDAEMPIYRELWEHIKKDMPKKGGETGEPDKIPSTLKSALNSLYGHYKKVFELWEQANIETPPVFIVVCNNTTSSKLIYEWISGWQRPHEDKEMILEGRARLDLFSNFDDYDEPLAKPRTLLIDSRQIESGGDLDKKFKDMAGSEIGIFRRERKERGEHGDITDAELLREVMNTVGKKDRLGAGIRCVVSVSMLTEGWDANTVTHILGVRAFGTQLLCEQVVGRALRRLNYDLNEKGLFDSEYADILGIPFDFTAKSVVVTPKPPKKQTHVKALKERENLEIRFPRVVGYRIDLPEEKLEANFTESSFYEIDPKKLGAGKTLMEGVGGKSHTLSSEKKPLRESRITMNLAKEVLRRHFCDGNGKPKWHLFSKMQRICSRWLDEGYLKCPGNTSPSTLEEHPEIMDQVCERINTAIEAVSSEDKKIRAVLDPYNKEGSSRHVNFMTTKDVRITSPQKCHVNYVALDSTWESELCRVVESHEKVIAYVKNQGLEFTVPYKDGNTAKNYYPDFIVKLHNHDREPIHVIVEIKGFREGREELKKAAVEQKWIPSVNRLKTYGLWTFIQLEKLHEIDCEFSEAVKTILDSQR